jgi:hypothetical protein
MADIMGMDNFTFPFWMMDWRLSLLLPVDQQIQGRDTDTLCFATLLLHSLDYRR